MRVDVGSHTSAVASFTSERSIRGIRIMVIIYTFLLVREIARQERIHVGDDDEVNFFVFTKVKRREEKRRQKERN